jgi:hypothetical protein
MSKCDICNIQCENKDLIDCCECGFKMHKYGACQIRCIECKKCICKKCSCEKNSIKSCLRCAILSPLKENISYIN